MRGAQLYTVTDLLSTLARRHPARLALTGQGTRLSYAELHRAARTRAGQLAALGAEPGDRIGILLPRGADALACFFGGQLLGAVTVFIDDRLKPAQIEHVLSDSGARLVATSPRLRGRLPGGWPGSGVLDTSSPGAGADGSQAARRIGRDLAALMFTSGSTGPPKGVMFTQGNLVSGARIVADYLGLSPADRTLAVLPWSFDYGLNQVLATFWAGGCVVVQTSAFAPDICRSLAQYSVTGLAGVPALWELLSRRPSPFLKLDLPALRYVTNSGGPLTGRVIAAFRRSHPHVAIYSMYGLTEAFRSSCLSPAELAAHPRSIGRAIPDTEILVLGADGRRCDAGEVGELVHSGPTVAAGYWGKPAATARVFRPHPFPPPGAVPATVVYSGDYVTMDAEGLLYYVGRRDSMFKSLGIRTNPTEIETAMLAAGLISEVVVHAIPQDDGEPRIVATLVPAEPGDAEQARAAVEASCQAALPPHLRPHRYVVVPDLPRTTSGKPDRAAVLRQLPRRASGS